MSPTPRPRARFLTQRSTEQARGKSVDSLAQKLAMRATVGGKDAPRFQALARQYLAQMKNTPVVADTKPAKPKEVAAPQVACGD
jgi:hypothetical protein